MSSDNATPYVLGDWGTSHLRLYLVESLMDGNRVCAERAGPGIGGLTRAPADVLQALLADWKKGNTPLDVTLCGMASSRTGLYELAYSEAPADLAGWARSARHLQLGELNVLLATGLTYRDESGQDEAGTRGVTNGDVMRGEETQVFGALQLAPTLRDGAHCVVLPGTHSKWVVLESGTISRFRTAITGELFALLSRDSTLLKATTEAGDASESDDGFAAGGSAGLALRTSLLSALFQTRTAQLLQGRSRAWASGYLSGLLIGYEVASMGDAALKQVTVIGQSRLAQLYRQIFTARGVKVTLLDGADCARAGLLELRDLWWRNQQ